MSAEEMTQGKQAWRHVRQGRYETEIGGHAVAVQREGVGPDERWAIIHGRDGYLASASGIRIETYTARNAKDIAFSEYATKPALAALAGS